MVDPSVSAVYSVRVCDNYSSEAVSASAQCNWLNTNKQIAKVHTPYTLLRHTQSLPGLTCCTIWFTAFSHKCPFTHMCALITRWSSKYTNMCVSLQCGYYIYSSLRGRSIHIDTLSHTNVHAAKTVTVPMSAADHISKQIGGDNAFTPRHTHTLHEARSHLQILQLSGEAELQGGRSAVGCICTTLVANYKKKRYLVDSVVRWIQINLDFTTCRMTAEKTCDAGCNLLEKAVSPNRHLCGIYRGSIHITSHGFDRSFSLQAFWQ